MERVYNQIKRIIGNIDLDKIYKGFKKIKFIIKYDDDYYCYDQQFLNEVIFNNNLNLNDVIYEIKSNEFKIKDIVIDIITKMFEKEFNVNICEEQCLKYLLTKKDSNYFIKKYQQNLIMTSILRGNNTLINQYISLRDERRKNNTITLVEEEIEKNVGLVKYIELKLLELLKPEEYKYELRFIFDKLEDPTNLLNYINYITEYSIIYLLINNKLNDIKPANVSIEVDKPLFSFDKLILQKDKQTKKLLMHKMINSKKTYLKGKVLNVDFKYVDCCDNLLYLPNEITVLYKNKVITKKGDFILQLNEQLEIVDGYECFSLEKILV